MPHLPPLNAIRVFIAAARHLSVKQAAAELCVTAGAASRQIQLLEQHLGHALFERHFRAIKLSQLGEIYLAQVRPALAAIDSASQRLQTLGRRSLLHIEATPTFAMYWLIPRLADFQARHPDIELRLSTAQGLVKRSPDIDFHIRRDPAHFNGLPGPVFMTEYAALVASPRLPGLAQLNSTAAILRAPRIVMRSRPDLWPQWLAANHGEATAENGPCHYFDNTILAIQAAVEALGVAVIPSLFLDGQLGHSLLALAGQPRFASGSYSLLKSDAPATEAGAIFSDWLLEHARQPSTATISP